MQQIKILSLVILFSYTDFGCSAQDCNINISPTGVEYDENNCNYKYYYVDNFDYNMECYDSVVHFAKLIEIDTMYGYYVEFFYKSNSFNDLIKDDELPDFPDAKFNDYSILKYYYNYRRNQVTLLYINNGEIFKEEYIKPHNLTK